MSFLQPWMLFAAPLIALPIIIHLINQRRFQTVQWAAMLFLLAANKMSRGYARLRQWLILAARTLAIAGLLFAISRPLTSGWLGLVSGSKVDTTIILLDRSASMTERGASGRSKLESGVAQLVQSLGMLESNRYVLIDSANENPVEIESPDVLADLPETGVVSASADIPTMLEAASQYIQANRPSRCEIWICSDVRRNDWKDDSGRWQAIRNSIVELPQMVRFHLLAYADSDPVNRSIRVTDVRRVDGVDGAQLLLSFKISQLDPAEGTELIPITLEMDGVRTEPVTVEFTGTEVELKNQVIELDAGKKRGWGRVSIPSDANPADNEFYFVFDEAVTRRTVVVSDDPDASRPLEFASAITPDPEIVCEAQTVTPEQLIGVDWSQTALVLWQADLPEVGAPDSPGAQLQTFLDRGGRVIFFPPTAPSDDSFAGVKWTQWQEGDPHVQVATWVGDQDLLANTRSGASLPVGELKVKRYCGMEGDKLSLATLNGGAPLLARALTDARNVYFCSTTTAAADSSVARDGVVLYAMIQRTLAAGAKSLGNTRQYDAGTLPATNDATRWRRLIGNEDALSNEFDKQAGIYREEEKLLAINRSALEDIPAVVPPDRVNVLFEGLEFDRVDDTAGSGASLIQEIWRLFLLIMMAALVLEAALCVPKKTVASSDTLFATEGGAS